MEKKVNLELTETPSGEVMLAQPPKDTPIVVKSERKRIKCSCGERFNKEDTAIDHLYKVRD